MKIDFKILPQGVESRVHCTARWIGPFSVFLQLRKPHSSFPAEPTKCCQGWELGYWNHRPLILPFNQQYPQLLIKTLPAPCSQLKTPAWLAVTLWSAATQAISNFLLLTNGAEISNTQSGGTMEPHFPACQPIRLRNIGGKREQSDCAVDGEDAKGSQEQKAGGAHLLIPLTLLTL